MFSFAGTRRVKRMEGKVPGQEKQAKHTGKKALNNYAYYSGLGFQMLAVIGIFTFIGYKIDEGRPKGTPWFTALFSLIGVFGSMYLVIKSLKRK